MEKKRRKKTKKRGHGEGTIYQRDDGRWCGQVTVGRTAAGKTIRETFYGSSQKEVQDKILHRRTELMQFGERGASEMTMQGLREFWLLSVKHNLSPGSHRKYTYDSELVIPYIGHQKVRELVAIDIVRMYDKMERDGISSAKRHRAGIRLRQMLNKAMLYRFCGHNPALAVPLPRHRYAEMQPLSPEQVTTFLAAAAGDRLYALYVVGLDTGARLGELLALTREDWNPTARTLRFIKTLDEEGAGKKKKRAPKESKTKNSRRTVRLGQEAATALQEHLARMNAEGHNSPLIFPTKKGTYYPRNNINDYHLPRLLEAAGLPEIRFHDLRHTCATLLLLAGVDVKTVAARLGHANPATTLKTYAHMLPESENRAAAAMDGFLRGNSQSSCSKTPEPPPE